MTDAVVRFGPFTFDRKRMAVTRDGRSQGIGGRGAALLGALLDAGDGIVSKQSLMEAAWPNSVVEEANLTVQIATLRKALGERSDGSDWIATVPRVGYRLVADEGPARSTRPSIAVLPFANLSNDPEQDYFADGVVEDLITALSRFKTFAIVARNSSFVYKGRAIDVREVARDLGVRYLLEGSVRRAGNKVRVAAQLIEGATGEHLWAERFDGTLAGFFDFQDTITTSVIGLIEPQIRKAEIERARRKRPESLDTWDLYVQALPLVHSAHIPHYTTAIDLLERAIAIDSSYAPALALASWAHEKRHTFGGPDLHDFGADVERCLALAERAVEADADDAFALSLLGWLRILFRRDYGAMTLVDHAVSLNPNNLAVLDFAAVAHLHAGSLDNVIEYATRAFNLSPGAPDRYMCLTHICSAHFCASRFEEAIRFARQSIDLESSFLYSHLFLAGSYAMLDRMDEARAEMAVAIGLRPDISLADQVDDPMLFEERKAIWIVAMRRAGMPEG